MSGGAAGDQVLTAAGTAPGDADRASEVMKLATAYQGARLVHVATRLGLPDLLVTGPRHAEDLATEAGAHGPSLGRLLRALAAHRICVEEPDGRFGLGPLGWCLTANAPGSMRDLVLMWGDADFWRSWGELERCIRTGETAIGRRSNIEDAFARYATDRRLAEVFNAGMSAMSAATATSVVDAYDFSAARHIVDVGGGQGRLLAQILHASPEARGVLLDRPDVVAEGVAHLAAAGVLDRCDVSGGDMFSNVPAGGDLYVLKSVLHDWDDARASTILLNCRLAIGERPEARLVIVERVLPERIEATAADVSRTLADVNMLVRTGGRERTEAEFRTLLSAAGLRLLRLVSTASHLSLIEAAPLVPMATDRASEMQLARERLSRAM